MENSELVKKIEKFKSEGKNFSIYTTCYEWKNSSIQWDDDLYEDDDYIYEIVFFNGCINIHTIPAESISIETDIYNITEDYFNRETSWSSDNWPQEEIDNFYVELIENYDIFVGSLGYLL